MIELRGSVGVDEMSWDDMSKNEMEWPTIAKVSGGRAVMPSTPEALTLSQLAADTSEYSLCCKHQKLPPSTSKALHLAVFCCRLLNIVDEYIKLFVT